MNEPQLCTKCEYELEGLGRPGKLVRCPECGTTNRLGAVDFDQVHLPMPPWWYLAWRLTWPAILWAIPLGMALYSGNGNFVAGMLFVGSGVLIADAARTYLFAFDCSNVSKRMRVMAWMMFVALAAHVVGIAAMTGAAMGACWVVEQVLQGL